MRTVYLDHNLLNKIQRRLRLTSLCSPILKVPGRCHDIVCADQYLECTVMTRFRPCIDLHAGSVKQIVGGTLDAANASTLKTNYVSELPAEHYARLYKDSECTGAHVIMLGPGNDEAAREALAAWPGMLQLGGGINDTNARQWMEAGASKVRAS